jgi:hypothetical protein
VAIWILHAGAVYMCAVDAQSSPAHIEIGREDHVRHRLARYRIRVDGNRVGRLRNGKLMRIRVPAGEHHVQVRGLFLRSQEVAVDLPPDGLVWLKCEPDQGWSVRLEVFHRPEDDPAWLR